MEDSMPAHAASITRAVDTELGGACSGRHARRGVIWSVTRVFALSTAAQETVCAVTQLMLPNPWSSPFPALIGGNDARSGGNCAATSAERRSRTFSYKYKVLTGKHKRSLLISQSLSSQVQPWLRVPDVSGFHFVLALSSRVAIRKMSFFGWEEMAVKINLNVYCRTIGSMHP